MATPPLDRWAGNVTFRELARLARDSPDVDAGQAWRQPGRLTAEQRRCVDWALEALRETRSV
jgi:hypothetical protein